MISLDGHKKKQKKQSKVSNDSQRSLSTDFWVFILATGLLRLDWLLSCFSCLLCWYEDIKTILLSLWNCVAEYVQRFHLFSDCQDCWKARVGFWCGGEGRRRCCCGSHDCQDYQGKTSQVPLLKVRMIVRIIRFSTIVGLLEWDF